MGFSTSKRDDPPNGQKQAIRPLREAIFAGVAVALSIAFGAYLVYDRACREKIADEQHHLAELATRVAALGRNLHRAMLRTSDPDHRARASSEFATMLKFVRDNDRHVRRIYSFSISESGPELLSDTENARPLPALAHRAAAHFLQHRGAHHWVASGLDAAGFAVIREGDHPLAAVGIESDIENLHVRIRTIRESLWITALLGLALGFATGGVVWRVRSRSAVAVREFEETRQIENATFASLGEVVYRFDIQAGFFHWRANTRQLLGFEPPPDGQPRSDWISRIHPDDQLLYIAALREAASSDGAMEIEYRVKHDDGRTVWLFDRSRAVRLHDNRRFLVGSLIDITQRRNAEETLRLFFEETSMAHMIFDGDEVINANPAAASLLGAQSPQELFHMPIWKLWPRRQRSRDISAEEWSRHVLDAMEHGSCQFEWMFQRPDGTQVDCDVFLRHTTLQDRTVLLVACYDITPGKVAQLQLIESERRFRDVSESIGEFIWEVDQEGRYTYVSPRVREVFGRPPESVIGHNPIEWVPEADREEFLATSNAIVARGATFRGFEHRILRADGQILWVSVSGVPNFDSHGVLTGFRGASLDITKHRAYEEELVLQKNAAEAADLAKSSFLAMMSHEIRTPLNSVLGFADLMLGTPLTQTQRDYLLTIKRSGDALLVVINDVLDFTKIESGRMEVEFRPTNLVACVREVLDMYFPAAGAKDLTLDCRIGDGIPTFARTDPARLRQILINLVGNAVKFTDEGSIVVTLSLADAGARIRFSVADTGIGIGESERERLFKPFSQADSSTTRRYGGTGLGLVISQRLAGLLGGSLVLARTSAEGSEFVLEIPNEPITDEERREMGDEPRNDLHIAISGPPPRVLVVDDNALNCRLTSLLLQQLGAQAITAQSAAECFDELEKGGVDLVLMDVQMPGMDGLDATRRLREIEQAENRPRLPVVALTANAMTGDRERCLAAGMDGYLSKPLRRDALLKAIEEFARPRAPRD